MAGMIDRAQRSPTGWLLACVGFGAVGALVGAIVSWAAGWPAPIAVVAGTGIGLLLAVRALRRPAGSIAVVPSHADLREVRSDLVGLRWFDARDARAESLAATIDEDVARSMGWTPAEVGALAAMASDPARLAAQGFLAVVDPGTDEVCGVVSLTHEPGVATTARVGIWLGPGARGRGVGPAALRLAVGLAWQMGLRSVLCGTTAENTAMQRTFLAVGGELVETVAHELPDGRTVDSCWYELTRPDGID